MPVSDNEWSKTEQKIAKEAFDKAYERESMSLLDEIRQRSSAIANLEDVWHLHDFLSARRHDIDGKYDYRYSVLIFVFARLLKEGWLHLNDLQELDKEKLTKIAALSRM